MEITLETVGKGLLIIGAVFALFDLILHITGLDGIVYGYMIDMFEIVFEKGLGILNLD